jgi:hypothetical protein
MKPKNFTISNINLLSLINILNEIYDGGNISYIDIIGSPDDERDKLLIKISGEDVPTSSMEINFNDLIAW